MGKMKKKYEAGTAVRFVSREQAMKKLQLTLKDFRRLCILKGIYPREPKSKRKASKGGTTLHTYYALKDIQFLLHEPVINKFREHKVYIKRWKKALHRDDKELSDRVKKESEPSITIDHIVRERYPTFTDALRDVDDALCLIFIFARLPKIYRVKMDLIQDCRRLAVEFMHYVIAAKCLRKVFVSIKGIYYQAEIQGETVTWIVQHDRGFVPMTDVDFNVMSTFGHFYSVFLGFVNYKLYQSLGLHYPPKLLSAGEEEETSSTDVDELIASLAISLKQSQAIALDQAEFDTFDEEGTPDAIKKAKEEVQRQEKQKRLFENFRFFLSREVPREALAFVIRSCGGEVSWSSQVGYGATYGEDDECITHQVVDRPAVQNQKMDRWYIQPQWVFDCLNARELLPMEPYYPGTLLPPHLSPFVDDSPTVAEEDYDELEDQPATSKTNGKADEKAPGKKKSGNTTEDTELAVTAGKRVSEHPQFAKNKAGENKKLQELMIPRKQRKIYQSMKKAERQKKKQTEAVKRKRKMLKSDNVAVNVPLKRSK